MKKDRLDSLIAYLEENIKGIPMWKCGLFVLVLKVLEDSLSHIGESEASQKCNDLQHKIFEDEGY